MGIYLKQNSLLRSGQAVIYLILEIDYFLRL